METPEWQSAISNEIKFPLEDHVAAAVDKEALFAALKTTCCFYSCKTSYVG